MLNEKAKEEESKVDISFSQSIPMNTNRQNSFNIGYLFLQKIFYDLGFDNICNNIKRKHKYDYDLTSILSRLLYSRIIYPSSKKSSFELSKNFIEEIVSINHQRWRIEECFRIMKHELKAIERIFYYGRIYE